MMSYEEWCEKFILPIVTQYNDGAITLEDMTNAIYFKILNDPMPSDDAPRD